MLKNYKSIGAMCGSSCDVLIFHLLRQMEYIKLKPNLINFMNLTINSYIS